MSRARSCSGGWTGAMALGGEAEPLQRLGIDLQHDGFGVGNEAHLHREIQIPGLAWR